MKRGFRSRQEALDAVKELADDARMMTGALHPDVMDEARAEIAEYRRKLNALVRSSIPSKARRRMIRCGRRKR